MSLSLYCFIVFIVIMYVIFNLYESLDADTQDSKLLDNIHWEGLVN